MELSRTVGQPDQVIIAQSEFHFAWCEDLSLRAMLTSHLTVSTSFRNINALLTSILHLLPDMSIYFNVDDIPARGATYAVRQRSIALAKKGECQFDFFVSLPFRSLN